MHTYCIDYVGISREEVSKGSSEQGLRAASSIVYIVQYQHSQVMSRQCSSSCLCVYNESYLGLRRDSKIGKPRLEKGEVHVIISITVRLLCRRLTRSKAP